MNLIFFGSCIAIKLGGYYGFTLISRNNGIAMLVIQKH